MKYVITPRGPILFPDTFNHSDFTALNLPIESAGSILVFIPNASEVKGFIGPGGSLTLGISSSETDADEIINLLTKDS